MAPDHLLGAREFERASPTPQALALPALVVETLHIRVNHGAS